jgi:branched-subunit amino acid transport protein
MRRKYKKGSFSYVQVSLPSAFELFLAFYPLVVFICAVMSEVVEKKEEHSVFVCWIILCSELFTNWR